MKDFPLFVQAFTNLSQQVENPNPLYSPSSFELKIFRLWSHRAGLVAVMGSAPFCPCRLLNLSPISGLLVCLRRILMRKASSALDEIMTFSMYESVDPL